jgi:hypothetical protein
MKPAELSGLITEEIGQTLQHLAAEVPGDQAIVEVGSFKGKSTCYLAAGGQAGEGAKVWAVDPWDTPGNVTGRFGFAEPSTREAFEAQVRAAQLWDCITPLQGFSIDIAARWSGPSIGLLYIDGDHSEAAVRADFDVWRPHFAPGATVVFDDLDVPRNPGVRAAIESLGIEFHVEAERLAVHRV